MVSLKDLQHEGYEFHSLHPELVRQYGYSKRQLKRIPNETLIWHPETTQIYCLPATRRKPQWIYPEISGQLNQTKKIKYKPEIDFLIMMGTDHSTVINEEINFYRAIHSDTRPFLQVHNMWLATFAFQVLLSETFNNKIPAGTLTKDDRTEYLIPRLQKRMIFNTEKRTFTPPSRESLTLAKWDNDSHCWKPWN